MIQLNRFWTFVISIIFFIVAGDILISKDFSIKGNYVYFGNWAYLIGGVVMMLGLLFWYITFKKAEKKKTGSDPK